MFRAFAILVRTSYLLMVLVVFALAAPWLAAFAQSWLTSPSRALALRDLYVAAALILLTALPLRALLRLVRHAELVPDLHIRERPVVASLVILTSILGCALVLLVGWVALTALPARDIGGPLAFCAMLATMLFAIALLSGECVLVGRIDQPTR